jgi:hypothetical protein
MKSTFACAAAAAILLACPAPPARATCVIAPDGKSIAVVTDNGETSEKNCAVKCRVDTKIGVAQVSCGGNTPPLARAHALCSFDKPEPYYKKVLSSEDTCKPTPAGAAAPAGQSAAPLPQAASPDKPSFACRIAADGRSAEAVILNPYGAETSCTIDCRIATTRAGATFSLSCSKTAAAGVETVLCARPFEGGKLVKMVGGKASCVKPLAAADDDAAKDDDDDPPIDQDEILKRMQRGEPMQNWMKK